MESAKSNENEFRIQTLNRKYNGFGNQDENEEKKWNGSFCFVQAADTQLGLIDRYILKKKDEDITWNKEINYLKLTIESVNRLNPKPKFMVICGDLVDAYPDWTKLRTEQVKDLKSTLGKLDPEIKLVCVCGNHDIGDEPSVESIQVYKQDFGDDYFSFWLNGCKFIVLNSQLYFNSNKCPELREAQDKWLEEELKLDVETKPQHFVIFQHIPLFIKEHDEPADVYFNIEPKQRAILLDRFRKAGVKKIFCGHYHRNAGGFYEDFECVVTTAIGAQLGSDKHGYRLVQVNENEITHEYISVTDQVN